jgi:hypothetical protein
MRTDDLRSCRHAPDPRDCRLWRFGAVFSGLTDQCRRQAVVRPFARCQGGNLSGNNYLKDVVEPSVAMSGATIVGAWQQDRWSNGALMASLPVRQGRRQDLAPQHPSFGRCTPGGLRYDRADDPWISIGPDGAVYATAMVFDGGRRSQLDGSRGLKGWGLTWQHAQTIDTRNSTAQFLDDKDTVTADPVRAGTAYAVWRWRHSDNRSPLVFAKTTDGGVHWSKPRVIVPFGGHTLAAIGGQIVVDPKTGMLFNVFLYGLKPSPSRRPQAWIAAMTSRDGGATWSRPHLMVQTGELAVQSVVRSGSLPWSPTT